MKMESTESSCTAISLKSQIFIQRGNLISLGKLHVCFFLFNFFAIISGIYQLNNCAFNQEKLRVFARAAFPVSVLSTLL